LRAADAELRAGHADAALTNLATYDREVGDRGQLAEEAAATEVEARCALHDVDAREHWTHFIAAWPSSPERARLARACSVNDDGSAP
jgi:hypothetical protein